MRARKHLGLMKILSGWQVGAPKQMGWRHVSPILHILHALIFMENVRLNFMSKPKDHLSCATHDTLDEAFDSATKSLPEAGVILLSPAAASFDQFPEFWGKSSHFAALVSDYLAKDTSPSETGGQPC